MKSNIEKVYSKLPKTELAKVELGVADDVKSLMKEFDSEYKKLDNLLDNYYKKIFALEQEFSPVSKAYTNFDKTIKDLKNNSDLFVKQAKELGIKANELPLYKNADAALKRSQNMVSEFFEANRISKKIKGAI